MLASDVLQQLAALGITLRPDGDSLIATPSTAMTEAARDLIRAHKAELLALLASSAAGQREAAAEARRQRALEMLAAAPAVRYAAVTDEDDPAYPTCVVIGLAIRQEGRIVSFDMIVPRDRYDGCVLLELLERHTAGSA